MTLDNSVFLPSFFQCVGDDIEDLEFTPKPEFEGFFKVTNVQNEVMVVCSKSIPPSCFIVVVYFCSGLLIFYLFVAKYYLAD